MCDNFRRKTEYLDACYESWKAVLDKFDSLLKSVRSLSPNPGDALQRLIDDAKAKLMSKRDELEKLYDGNVELLRKGVELHETAPIVIRLEVNWSQIVRTAWATADASGAAAKDVTICTSIDPMLGATTMSTPNSEMAIPFAVDPGVTRSTSNSPCLFGSIGSGLTASNVLTSGFNSRSGLSLGCGGGGASGNGSAGPGSSGGSGGGSATNGTSSAEPFLNCFGLTDCASTNGNNQPTSESRNSNVSASGGFDSSWLPGWAGVDFAAFQKEQQKANGSSNNGTTGPSGIFGDILTGHQLFSSDAIVPPLSSGASAANNVTGNGGPGGGATTSPPSFSSIVSIEGDKHTCFDWLFNCLKDWRAKKLLSVPFELLLDNCSAQAEPRLWRALNGESVDHLVAFMKQYPGVFAISQDSGTVSLVMSAPSADPTPTQNKDCSLSNNDENNSGGVVTKATQPGSKDLKETPSPLTATTSVPVTSNSKTPVMSSKQRRSGSLLELDDFGNTSNSSHESASSNSMVSDDGSWQEVVKKVQKNNAGKPNMPCATDIRERIIDVLDLTSHGSNLSKLIAVEILRRAVKENAVPRDLTADSIEKLRLYLPNALSSARGKLARPKPNLPPEHADWTYKTKLCVQFATTRQCTMGPSCRFAHGLVELRPKRRAEYCSYWKKSGTCPRRDSCQYAHSADELGQYVDAGRGDSVLSSGSAPGRPALSIQPATMSISLTSPINQPNSPTNGSGDSSDSCWLCKGQRRGMPSKQLKCGHKYHSQCLNKFSKKQQVQTNHADVSATLMPDEAVCPKCRTVAIATVAVNV